MELLTLEIKPLSHFATLPKGDTIFGQILAYLFLEKDNTFENYLNEEPKLIISDMMPYGYVYRPNLPLSCFKNIDEKDVDKKNLRKKRFISLENLQNGRLYACENICFMDRLITIKNSINRVTFTTKGDEFAPYGIEEKAIYRKLWIFVLVESVIKEKILSIFEKISKFGFGKDANLGKGIFEFKVISNNIKDIDTPYNMSVSPAILMDSNILNSWYEPFIRFGKYGLHNAHKSAFKNPVLMADSSSVVTLKQPKQYFGSCIDNGIKNKPSFLQGYSISIPFLLEDKSCLNTN